MTTTIDDFKLEQGIKKIFPNAQTSYDSQGNLLVSIDNRDEEGNPLGVSTFYPNPKGLDRSTVLQLAGAIGAAPITEAVIGKAIGAGSTRGFRGAATTAAVEAASSSITGLPYDWSAPVSGAIFGPTFLGMGKLLGKAGSYLINKYKNNPSEVFNPDGTFTQATRNYIQGQGLNPDDIQGSLFNEYKTLVQQGYIPQEALIKAQAAGLPVKIELTTGQIQRDLGQMLYEDMLSKGATEAQAASTMRQFYDEQVAAVRSNIEELSRQMGAGTRREGAAAAQEVLRAQRDRARQIANDKYDQARAIGQAFLDPSSATRFADETLLSSLETFNRNTTPKTYALVDDLRADLKNGADVDQIQVRRQQLTTASREQGAEGEAARAAIDALDNYLDEVVTANLFLRPNQMDMFGEVNTSDQSIIAWKDAINTWSGFKQKWETKGILQEITEKEMRDGKLQFKIAPEDAANYIFANSFLGLTSKRNIARDVRTLKEQLAPEDWTALRGEVVIKLFDGTLTDASENIAQGVKPKLSTDWAAVKSNNKALIDVLFNKEEQGLISSLANVSGRIANRTQNRSNRGAAIGNLVGRLFASFGGTVPAQALAPILSRTLGPLYRSGRSAAARKGRMTPPTPSPIIIGGASSVAADPESKETLQETMEEVPGVELLSPLVAPPQARVAPPAPQTRGVPGMEVGTEAPAPEAAVPTGPVSASSREMLQQLFPTDFIA